jgi:hypothetical protein
MVHYYIEYDIKYFIGIGCTIIGSFNTIPWTDSKLTSVFLLFDVNMQGDTKGKI